MPLARVEFLADPTDPVVWFVVSMQLERIVVASNAVVRAGDPAPRRIALQRQVDWRNVPRRMRRRIEQSGRRGAIWPAPDADRCDLSGRVGGGHVECRRDDRLADLQHLL